MKWRRTWAVARKEFLHVVRDFRSLVMAIAMPALMLTLFGYALTLDVDNVPLAVWDQSGTERSRELISRFAGSRYFSLRSYVNNYADLVRAIDQGQVMMGLVVPRDFAQQVDAGRDAPVQLIVDGSDSNTATIAIGYADVIAEIYALDLQRGAEPAPRRLAADDSLGRAAAGVVQRGTGIEELHHSRPDRRDHDGHCGAC